MSDAKRKRISKALVRDWGRNHPRKQRNPLNSGALEALSAIEHVERVEPFVQFGGKAFFQGKAESAGAASLPWGASYLRSRLLTGRLFTAEDNQAAIVNEYLLYRLGLTGDDAPSAVLGRTVRFEYNVGSSQQFGLPQMMTFGPNPFSEKEAQCSGPP